MENTSNDSALVNEVNRIHDLLTILENTFGSHVNKLSPLLPDTDAADGEYPAGSDVAEKADYNPLYDTQVGRSLREAEWRIQNITDQIAISTRRVQA